MADARKRDGFIGRMFAGRRGGSRFSGAGVPGVAVYAGYPDTGEISREIATREARYRTYGDILANRSIVAAGVRLTLNMIGASRWTFDPSESDESGEFAERLEMILMEDLQRGWHEITRRAATHRFYGFSVQEFWFTRHAEGYLTLADIAPRAQRTIEKWDTDPAGMVLGCVQRDPQTSMDIYLPRNKLLYLVDDALHDSPEGMGLFRHLVAPSQRLQRYEQLEGYAFETDLRGVPVGYAPLSEYAAMMEGDGVEQAEIDNALAPMKNFLEKHIAGPARGYLFDSAVYESSTDTGETPSSTPKWSVELLSASVGTITENAAAIERLNREIARILGVEQLLLGATSTGSLALSEDKTHAFNRIIDSVLQEVRDAVIRDIVKPLWMLNGWPEEMMPDIGTEAPRHRDPAEMAATLRDMASAGATMEPDDPAQNDLRQDMGLTPVDLDAMRERAEEEAALQAEEMAAMREQTMNGPRNMPPGDDE